jgi:SAM-dependent methyltransferase
MPHSVCPWWMGYFLVSPLRRLRQDPGAMAGHLVRPGMRILEPGPGMGFFTLELARLSGADGHVFAVDVQPRMLARLSVRARRAGLTSRISARLAKDASLGVGDLRDSIDLVWAFAVVHEVPDSRVFFAECFSALKHRGTLLVAEPAEHVGTKGFSASMDVARHVGFTVRPGPIFAGSLTALLVRE